MFTLSIRIACVAAHNSPLNTSAHSIIAGMPNTTSRPGRMLKNCSMIALSLLMRQLSPNSEQSSTGNLKYLCNQIDVCPLVHLRVWQDNRGMRSNRHTGDGPGERASLLSEHCPVDIHPKPRDICNTSFSVSRSALLTSTTFCGRV